MKIHARSVSKLILSALVLSAPSAWANGNAGRIGDLVFKGTEFDTLFVGHVGVLYKQGTVREVADVSGGRGEHAVTKVRTIGSFEQVDYWGARRFGARGISDAQQASLKGRVDYFALSPVTYDYNHLDQKGTWFNHNLPWEPASHWEFDCVGFTERVYEDIGFNPTPNSYESGLGWPLTPSEQYESSNLRAPQRLFQTRKYCVNDRPMGTETEVSLTSGKNDYTCGNTHQDSCVTHHYVFYTINRCI